MSTAVAAAPSAPAPNASAEAAPDASGTPTLQDTTVPSAASPGGKSVSTVIKVGDKAYSEAELQALISTSATLDARLQEISTREAAFQSSLKQIKDPAQRRALLKAHDVDYVQEAEDVLLEHLREQEMTPEQRELAELKAFKAEREREAAESKAKAEEERTAAQTAELTAAYEAQFIEAMETAQLPRSPRVAMELLEIVQDCLARDIEITPKEAALILRGRITEANRPVFEGMSVDQLQSALGPKVVQALIKAHTASLQTAAARGPDDRSRIAKPKAAPVDDKDFWNTITKVR